MSGQLPEPHCRMGIELWKKTLAELWGCVLLRGTMLDQKAVRWHGSVTSPDIHVPSKQAVLHARLCMACMPDDAAIASKK